VSACALECECVCLCVCVSASMCVLVCSFMECCKDSHQKKPLVWGPNYISIAYMYVCVWGFVCVTECVCVCSFMECCEKSIVKHLHVLRFFALCAMCIRTRRVCALMCFCVCESVSVCVHLWSIVRTIIIRHVMPEDQNCMCGHISWSSKVNLC